MQIIYVCYFVVILHLKLSVRKVLSETFPSSCTQFILMTLKALLFLLQPLARARICVTEDAV